MNRLLLILLLVLAAVPATADAARVRVDVDVDFDDDDGFDRDDTEFTTASVDFFGAKGERNRVTVRPAGRGRVRVTDSRNRLRAGADCRKVSLHVAICSFPEFYDLSYVSVALGDRADRLVTATRLRLAVFAYGEDGADVLRGGRRADFINGGPGRDRIAGLGGRDSLRGDEGRDSVFGGEKGDFLRDGAGRDVLRGGAGPDSLRSNDHPGRAVADVLDGGRDTDTVTYASRKRGIFAAIGGRGGLPGEGDRLVAVEDLVGGRGDDELRGDGARNRIGGGGGIDTYDAGAGNDRIGAGGGFPEGVGDVTCGAGRDTVSVGSTGAQMLRPDCEFAGIYPAQPVAQSADAVTMRLGCGYVNEPAEARSVTLKTPAEGLPFFTAGPFGTTVGAGERPISGETLCDTALTLTEEGKQLRASQSPLPVTVFASSTTAWSFELSAP